MSLFDLYPNEDANKLDEALRAPNKAAEPTSMFEGALTAIPRAIGSAAEKISAPLVAESRIDLLGAMSPTFDIIPNVLPTEDPVQTLKDQRAEAQRVVQQFQPDARTNGAVSNLLFGVTDVGSRVLAGAAVGGPAGILTGPLLAGTTEGYNTAQQMKASGVDEETANRMGIVSGSLTTGGAMLPIFGKSLATQLASGAVGNVAFGAISRGSTSKMLADAGYPQMADQYHWLDAQDMLADTVLGLAFGGIHHAFAPSTIDTAMGAKDQVHSELDSAPGIPRTLEARGNHDANMRAALQQKLDDQPVTNMLPVDAIPNIVQDAAREATTIEASKLAGKAFGERVEAPVEPEHVPRQVPITEEPAVVSNEARQEAEIVSSLQPDTQEALMRAKSIMEDAGGDIPVKDESGNEIPASQAMAQAMDDIKIAKAEGAWHQIAAACIGRG